MARGGGLRTGWTRARRLGKTGHEDFRKHSKPELWFFAVAIAEHFQFRPDWYRAGPVAGLVLQYYVVLRSVLRAKPHLRCCQTQCPHCGIFFLTHHCNARQRGQVRCPFGCREAQRRKEAIRRSIASNRSEQGKTRKQKINQRRYRQVPAPTLPPPPPPRRRRTAKAKARGASPTPQLLQHVRMVVSLIEGRRISRRQVRLLLAKIWRLRTLSRRRPIDHAVLWLHQQPP